MPINVGLGKEDPVKIAFFFFYFFPELQIQITNVVDNHGNVL